MPGQAPRCWHRARRALALVRRVRAAGTKNDGVAICIAHEVVRRRKMDQCRMLDLLLAFHILEASADLNRDAVP